MKKAFVIVVGTLFVFGTNSVASAQSEANMPVKAPLGYHVNSVADTVNFISRRHHRRRHNQGHLRGHRHGRHFRHDYRGQHRGYSRHNYGGWDPYSLLRPYGNYYSGRHFYRGRGYTGYRNHDRHDRRYRQDRHHSPRQRH